MVNLTKLTDDNFELFAAKSYKNYQCLDRKEFMHDLGLITEINKGLTKRQNVRLLVNQIIIFFNVFEVDSAVKMLFFKTAESKHPAVKTIMGYLSFLPNNDYDHISDDEDILEALKAL